MGIWNFFTVASGVWAVWKAFHLPPSSTQSQVFGNEAGGNQVVTTGNNNKTIVNTNNYYGFTKSKSDELRDIQNGQVAPDSQQTFGDVSLTIKGCLYIQSDTISCPITVLNSGPDGDLSIGGQSQSNFIQDQGGYTHPILTSQLGSSHRNPAQTAAANGLSLSGVVTYGGDGQPIRGMTIPRLYLK